MRSLVLIALAACLAAPTFADAPPAGPAPVPEPVEWDADTVDGDWTLYWDTVIHIACPEAKKQLRITLAPPWDVGDGPIQAVPFHGPIDKITVKLGDKSFEAVQDTAVTDKVVYVLPADADTVTAVMMASNVEIALTANPVQHREGNDSTDGTFDVFGTTCAQINGLK